MKDDFSSDAPRWRLSQAAFEKLLGWLDADPGRAGERYVSLRRKLIAFFEHHNKKIPPEDWADKVFDRIARKLEKGDVLPANKHEEYCRGVARMLLLEFSRCPESLFEEFESSATSKHLNKQSVAISLAALSEERARERVKQKSDCLNECLQRLAPEDRELLRLYYAGDPKTRKRNRRELAAKLGLTYGNLRVRACRLRKNVVECFNDCLERGDAG